MSFVRNSLQLNKTPSEDSKGKKLEAPEAERGNRHWNE